MAITLLEKKGSVLLICEFGLFLFKLDFFGNCSFMKPNLKKNKGDIVGMMNNIGLRWCVHVFAHMLVYATLIILYHAY